jgi:hypothetical protein
MRNTRAPGITSKSSEFINFQRRSRYSGWQTGLSLSHLLVRKLCDLLVGLRNGILTRPLYHVSGVLLIIIYSQMCDNASHQSRLYSRRRIFLLFGNPIRHRVHGTPPLDSRSSRSYLNPVHTCSHPIYCIRILVLPCQPRRRSNHQFLGVFAKLPTAAVRSVMSCCPCVRPHGTTRLPLDGFSWNLVWVFSKIRRENSSFFEILLE